MAKPPANAEIEAALAANNFFAIEGFLDRGLDANWRDPQGDTLLHHAARMGDAALVAKLVARGAKAAALNDNLESPADIAVIWGHDAEAADLRARQKAEGSAAFPAEALAFKTLQEIRDYSAATGIDQFHQLARQGRFAGVAALAAADANGFAAADLLGGANGERTVLTLCQRGELGLLFKAELWMRKPQEFQAVWAQVPEDYRKGHDADGFLAALRQALLQSYAKPKLGGFKK